MSGQVTITQLPNAAALTGAESVPVVQNGVTVQTTTGAIAGAGALNYPFLTVGSTSGLTDARYLSTTTGLSLTDGGAGSTLTINMTGAAASLNGASNGFIVKDGASTVVNRQLTVGAGMTIANGDGISGDPVIGVNTNLQNLSSLTGTGLMTINGSTFSQTSIQGTTDQIDVANGTGIGGAPTISIANDPILPGTGGVQVPSGTSAQRLPVNGVMRYNTDNSRFEFYQSSTWATIGTGDGTVTNVQGTTNQISVVNGTTVPVISIASNPTLPGTGGVSIPAGDTSSRPASPVNGTLRYNSDLGIFEAYLNNAWAPLASGSSGVTAIATGTGLTGGPITSTGTISIDSTVATLTGIQTLTNKTISGANNTVSVTNALTIGTGLSGTSFNGSTAVTIAIDSTVATLTGSQTLTNKSMSGSSNTFTNIPNSALTNSSVTVGTTSISLGGSSLTLGGLTSVAVTQDPVSNLELATKQYVDGLASTGLYYHQPVQCSTTGTLASMTGGTVTYNNGASGVGATLTLSLPLLVCDGYTLANTNRILVQYEANAAYNGVYTWATGGTILTRSTDTDSYGTGTGDLSENDYFFCQNGTINKGNAFVCTTAGTITFGTTPITFSQFSTSQVYTGTTPIQVSGTVISLTTVPTNLGGTGLTSFTSGGAVYATSTSALTTGTLPVASGGTSYASYATGDILYASASTTLSKLTIGANGYVLTSSGTAPQYVAQSTLSVGSATNATNVALTAGSGATNYLHFSSAATGNQAVNTNTLLTYNYTNNTLTAGINGGTF